MKGLLLFTLLALLSTATSLSPKINNSTRTKKALQAQRRQQSRRNYCFRSLESGGGQVQDQFPIYLDNRKNPDFGGGVSHLISTAYQHKSLYQSCQPILLSFSSSHNSSGSRGEDTMADFNRKNVDIADMIRTSLEEKPILYFQLKLSKQEKPTLSLPQQNTRELLKSLFFRMRTLDHCYFFIIVVTSHISSQQEHNDDDDGSPKEMIPGQVKNLFREALGDIAWMSSSYFLLINLESTSMLQLGQWVTFRNKLEIVCIQQQEKKNNKGPRHKRRLILQTFCSSCVTTQERRTPTLIKAVDFETGENEISLHQEVWPNFVKQGFNLNFVKRALRTRTPVSVQRIQKLMNHVTPMRRLYWEFQKSFNFHQNQETIAWLNGFQKPGQRDFIEEIERGGPFTVGLHFTPLFSVGFERIGYSFPYTEQRLAMLAKRQTPYSKWQILFEELKGYMLPIWTPIVLGASFLIAFSRTGPPPKLYGHRKGLWSFILLKFDWITYLDGTFFSQLMFPSFLQIPVSLSTAIFLVNMAGTLFMGTVRIHIASNLATQQTAKEIQSILQLNPVHVADGLLWKGGRFETNDELARLLPFQNARAAEAEKTSINLQYYYEPSTCVGGLLSKERYVCVAFEDYMNLVLPSLSLDLRRSLYIKIVDDLGTTDWVTIAHNLDFPWAQELTMWTLSLVESGIFQFWVKNMSLAIPDDGVNGGGEGGGESPFESENDDVDSYQAQQEGIQLLVENFQSALAIVVVGFLVELVAYSSSKFNWSGTILGKIYWAFVKACNRYFPTRPKKIRNHQQQRIVW